MYIDSCRSLSPNPVKSAIEQALSGCHPDFWFSDGNIILVVEQVLFKVHRGQLERHSEVFQSLFSVPQPLDAPSIEGTPIVELHDSPSDVSYLLRALYDGLYFKKPYANDFPAIAAVFRLSTKYFIEHLRERCASRMEIDWPSSLSGWDSREAEATESDGRYNPRSSCPHPILVVNLAREMHLSTILPAAFYDLCRYGPSKIFAGLSLSSPEMAPFKRLVTAQDQPDHPGQLSRGDLQIVLFGREAAQRATATFIEQQLSGRNIAQDCHNKDREAGRVCRESFYFIMLNLLRSVGGIACGRDSDPLYTLTQAVGMLSRNDFSDGTQLCALKICAACKIDFERSVSSAREHIWSQIPGWFGMQGFTAYN